MPASVLNVRLAARRACPVCTESVCVKPAECLYFLTSRPWADCDPVCRVRPGLGGHVADLDLL